MRANPAEYELVSPGRLETVLALLASEPGVWAPIAGGTELMVQFAAGRLKARKLVNICGLPELAGISETADGVRIAAGTTYTQLRQSALLAEGWPLLVRAASWTGAVANQNRGTLGGNLVNASPAADTPPALLVYGAELELVSVRGTRLVAYASFHTGYKTTLLAADELVLAVHVPRSSAMVHYLRKVGPREAQAISKVALAAVGSVVEGRIAGVAIALASVSCAPLLCIRTAESLDGNLVTDDLARTARACLMSEMTPLDDVRSTGLYRAQVAGNLFGEFLTQLRASV